MVKIEAVPAATLTVDLRALAKNYRALRKLAGRARVGAVVKADGYGLGAVAVARTLQSAGCDTFFVATPEEGAKLRSALEQAPRIFVLHGLSGSPPRFMLAHGLTPILNTTEDVADWRKAARGAKHALPAGLHINTGMNRLGLPLAAAESLAKDTALREDLALDLVMSHLACADEPKHRLNRMQQKRFADLVKRFAPASASLANSAGILLGADYCFDLVRPGIALYGANPTPGQDSPFATVAILEARVLQLREAAAGETVGYGATHRLTAPARLATIAAGYADGYMRAIGNRGQAFLAGRAVPVVGRVSMDLLTLDVSALPHSVLKPGLMAELFGPNIKLDEVAKAAGTIPYEILTRLGPRLARIYRGAA